ncbi:hypothetical protein NN3_42020 [Nocardia neocaledoniensis NBRC 108232]|uniref:Uncharacterized protein YukE n=1 Tax=Nocardia neocaledoniensis TaxID=236511 RepID=A0A317NY60_9NOCA|nr:hypothetical protein [Nocardia neocaledoniensis]PWV79134.1 uncharacterized protein YukE [Nocardia neocaledoniensis]GEM33195.1 hypothetical protein NN3_42020 [Nocardia neocaledoniensis NBRC 108232]
MSPTPSAEQFDLDPDAVRALAAGMGTAGQAVQVIGKGGALADGVFECMPNGDAPQAYQLAARRADKAMGAVGTALTELSGQTVGAVITFEQQDEAFAGALGGVAPR